LGEPHSERGLSPEAVKMATWVREDVASGKLSAEQAANIFNDLGVPRDQWVLPADMRTDEQKFIDDQFPVARPEDFLLRYDAPGQAAKPMTPEMTAFDQSARAWLTGAEFPATLGNSLITTIERTVQQTKHMTPAQLESYGLVEFEKLTRAYGGEDNLQEKLYAAAVMIEALDKNTPGLKTLLKSKGIGDNALVVSQLIGKASAGTRAAKVGEMPRLCLPARHAQVTLKP